MSRELTTKQLKNSIACKKYRANNKDKINKQHRERRINNLEKVLKSERENNWRRRGVSYGDNDKDEFYISFLNATNCWSCFKLFDNKFRNNKKCLDHIDNQDMPGNISNIRGFICHECNVNDNWKFRMLPDSIYQNYLEQYLLDNTPYKTP